MPLIADDPLTQAYLRFLQDRTRKVGKISLGDEPGSWIKTKFGDSMVNEMNTNPQQVQMMDTLVKLYQKFKEIYGGNVPDRVLYKGMDPDAAF